MAIINKLEIEEIQKKLEETFPVIASGSYVRLFEKSCICQPLNWGYSTDKPRETIRWEYRSNSRKLPFFMYREKYSYTTIQANFSIARANEQQPDISGMYLDQDELIFNQAQFDPQMTLKPTFKHDYLLMQSKVDDGDMLRCLGKFDRKLNHALSFLTYSFRDKTPIKKIPIERMFEPVRLFLAIPLIAEYNCAGNVGLPSEKEMLEYARPIWDKIDF